MRKKRKRSRNAVSFRMTTVRIGPKPKHPYVTPRRIKRSYLSDWHLTHLRRSLYMVLEQWPTEAMVMGRWPVNGLSATWSQEVDQNLQACYNVRAEGVLVETLAQAHVEFLDFNLVWRGD